MPPTTDTPSDYLLAAPEFKGWWNACMRDGRFYLGEIRALVVLVPGASSVRPVLTLCINSRLLWSRLHTAGLGRFAQPETIELGREFLALMEPLVADRDQVVERMPDEWKPRVSDYFSSMDKRCKQVRTWLDGGPDSLAGLLAIGTEGGGFNLAAPPAAGDSDAGMVLLCGAYWMLSQKLLSWEGELEHEKGPHALSVFDHLDLCHGTLRVFELLLQAANSCPSTPRHSIERAMTLLDEIVSKVHAELDRRWRAIQKERPFGIDDSTLADGDLEPHDHDDESERYLKEELPPIVKRFSKTASDAWTELRVQISDQDWQGWFTMSLSGAARPQLSANPREITAGQLNHVLAEVSRVNYPLVLERAIAAAECGVLPTDDVHPKAVINRLLGRLLQLDFLRGLPTAARYLTEASGGAPSGFYEIQLVGKLMRAAAAGRYKSRRCEKIGMIINRVLGIDPERYGGQLNRNSILSGLLVAYAATCRDDVAGILAFKAHVSECGSAAGDPEQAQYFYQALLSDALAFLPDTGSGNTEKLAVLAGFASDDKVRWNDPEIFDTLHKLLAGVAVAG